MNRLHRRRFLRVAGGCAAAGLVPGGLAQADERNSPAANDSANAGRLVSVTRATWALGTHVSITALGPRRDATTSAIRAAFDAIETVESVMSIYRPESQLSRLNRDSVLHDPHPWLVEVLRAARSLSKRTDGAFDVTVQPLWALYQSARREGRLPDEGDVLAARARVGWRRVEIRTDRVSLRGEGTAVTLNGIAQGFALDRAIAALQTHGVTHALIDTGELGSRGNKSSGEPWSVGIQHPREADAYVALVAMDGRALATSGDYATSFSDDLMHHHLFDPRTGRSPGELASVSVLAADGLQADALSTAVFVLGPRQGLELIGATPGADALFVLKEGRTLVTAGFPREA